MQTNASCRAKRLEMASSALLGVFFASMVVGIIAFQSDDLVLSVCLIGIAALAFYVSLRTETAAIQIWTDL
jgi:hypothetical protein